MEVGRVTPCAPFSTCWRRARSDAPYQWLARSFAGSKMPHSASPGFNHTRCGAASAGSPRREPWGSWLGIFKPREGRKKNRPRGSFAAPRLLPLLTRPTAHAVGYRLSPLRGWENRSKIEMRPAAPAGRFPGLTDLLKSL